MKREVAIREVRKLTLLRYFPTNVEAIEALVEVVCEWCAGRGDVTPEQQCAALVARAIATMREWQSPEALHDLFLDLYPPAVKRSSEGIDPNAEWIPPWKDEVPR